MVDVDPGSRDGERGAKLGKRVGHRGSRSGRGGRGTSARRRAVLHNQGEGGHDGEPARRGGPGAALRLLVADPEVIEPGLVLCDDDVRLDEDVVVDLLAHDGVGYPVAVLMCDDEPGEILGRLGAVVAALERGRHLLDRLYGDEGLQADLRPRVVLLSRRFSEALPALLDMITGLEVRALEFRVVRSPEGEPFVDLAPFHHTVAGRARSGGGGDGGARARPRVLPRADVEARGTPAQEPRPEPELELEPEDWDSVEELFQRARQAIRSLSPQVTEELTGEAGEALARFDVGGVPLAVLDQGARSLTVVVGDEEAELDVVSEQGFHDALNAVFNHFFTRFAARA